MPLVPVKPPREAEAEPQKEGEEKRGDGAPLREEQKRPEQEHAPEPDHQTRQPAPRRERGHRGDNEDKNEVYPVHRAPEVGTILFKHVAYE